MEPEAGAHDPARGFVTLPCRERDASAPQEFSRRGGGLAPRVHRRSAKHAMRLGSSEMALDVKVL